MSFNSAVPCGESAARISFNLEAAPPADRIALVLPLPASAAHALDVVDYELTARVALLMSVGAQGRATPVHLQLFARFGGGHPERIVADLRDRWDVPGDGVGRLRRGSLLPEAGATWLRPDAAGAAETFTSASPARPFHPDCA